MRVLRSSRAYVTTADGLWQLSEYAPGSRPPNQNQRPAGPAPGCPGTGLSWRRAVLAPGRPGRAVPRTSVGGSVLEILDQPARLRGINRDARAHEIGRASCRGRVEI